MNRVSLDLIKQPLSFPYSENLDKKIDYIFSENISKLDLLYILWLNSMRECMSVCKYIYRSRQMYIHSPNWKEDKANKNKNL